MSDFSIYSGPSKEWLALEPTLPVPPPGQPIEEKQVATNAFREAAAAKDMKLYDFHSKVKLTDYAIPTRDGSTVQARTYKSNSNSAAADTLPVYVHLHGGGFLFGTLSSEDATCSRIALNTGVIVLNVNYRHSPKYTYPTAWNDAEDAIDWLHDHISEIGGDPDQVVVGGISAGAWLASSIVLRQHLGEIITSRPKIAGQILMIPCVSHQDCYEPQLKRLKDPALSSFIENENAPILPASVARLFTDLLKVDDPREDDLRLSPGNASPEQVRGLPPAIFGITGLDPLRDQGLLYAQLLAENGVATDVHLFHGLPHGFRRYGTQLSESVRWDRVMEEGIKWALATPTASGIFHVKTE